MKKIIGLVLFLGIVAIGANILMKGGFPLKQSLSEEEQQLDRLRGELRAAQAEFRQAGRASGLSGVDTTAQGGAALAEVERIERELNELKRSLSSDVARQAADRLLEEIQDFKNEIR
jgi:hypothetical protein